jgi:2-C-methyl-D-erythritol 4-phosphate cytidylyltransferase
MYHGLTVGAVIVAAGSSGRMGGRDKVTALLGGRPVLVRVIDIFERCRAVDQIVVVLNEQNRDWGRRLVSEYRWSKVAGVYRGGKRRQDSVSIGLGQLRECEWVVVHDGARPLVTAELIERGLDEVQETGAAVAAVPVSDTIKRAGADRLVRETLPRRDLWAVQTPQVFRFAVIAEAYRQVKGEATDDASLVEQAGYRVKLYPGAYDNMKITTVQDLDLAEGLLLKRER